MNKIDNSDPNKELNDTIYKIINDTPLHLISRFSPASGSIRLRIDSRERIKIILGKKEFIHINEGNLLNQEYIDIFYVNTAEFLVSVKEFLKIHQINTSSTIDREMTSTKIFSFASKDSVSWLQKLNRFLGAKSFKNELEETSLGYAVVYRVINEIDDIISFYENHKDNQRVKGIPELLSLLKDLRYTFFNVLRSQRNYYNSIGEIGEITFGIPAIKLPVTA